MEQPRDYDAVLGGSAPNTRAVLGGIDGTRARFIQTQLLEDKIAVLDAIGNQCNQQEEAKAKGSQLIEESSIRTALHSAGQKPSRMAQFLIEQGIEGAGLIHWVNAGIPDTALALILEYYAYETQPRYRSQQAKLCCRAFNSIGIREWIKDSIGWRQTNGRPHWYRRLGLFRSKTKIPVGWWCIFEEIVSTIADLEELGYIPPEGIIPDVSVGKCWCNYLRDELKLNPRDIGRKYKHYYPDWVHPVSPYIYPLEYLPTFRVWFEEKYKPIKMVGYFRKADPVALSSICKLLGLPEGK